MTYSQEKRHAIALAVLRYQTAPNSVAHEQLLPEIEDYFGEDSAAFFDEEGCLPLNQSRAVSGFPWPMYHGSATYYLMGLTVAVASGATWAMYLLGDWDPIIRLVAGVAAGVGIWFGWPRLQRRLFPPKDLAERERLVRAFDALVARNLEARNAEAEGARDARRFNRIVGKEEQL